DCVGLNGAVNDENQSIQVSVNDVELVQDRDFPSGLTDCLMTALVESQIETPIQYVFEDLSGQSVDQSSGLGSGATITLDTAAAGHGWFIDNTPLDNEELAALQGLALVGAGDSQASMMPLSSFSVSMLGRLRQTLAGGWGVEYAQASAHSALSQAFILGAQDRYLRFTLSGVDLLA
ncbi:MAG: hypothetical protein ACKVQK_16270, partial [Burkholderiales bacterium]